MHASHMNTRADFTWLYPPAPHNVGSPGPASLGCSHHHLLSPAAAESNRQLYTPHTTLVRPATKSCHFTSEDLLPAGKPCTGLFHIVWAPFACNFFLTRDLHTQSPYRRWWAHARLWVIQGQRCACLAKLWDLLREHCSKYPLQRPGLALFAVLIDAASKALIVESKVQIRQVGEWQ